MTARPSPWHLERIPFFLNRYIQNTRADKRKLPPALLDGVALVREGEGKRLGAGGRAVLNLWQVAAC